MSRVVAVGTGTPSAVVREARVDITDPARGRVAAVEPRAWGLQEGDPVEVAVVLAVAAGGADSNRRMWGINGAVLIFGPKACFASLFSHCSDVWLSVAA